MFGYKCIQTCIYIFACTTYTHIYNASTFMRLYKPHLYIYTYIQIYMYIHPKDCLLAELYFLKVDHFLFYAFV